MRGRALAVATLILLAIASVALADETKTLKVELSTDPALEFAVENLVGTMTIIATDDNQVSAVATVHADREEIAEKVSFEQINDEGRPTLRVIYPLDEYTYLRYAEIGRTEVKYDGVRVRIGRRGRVTLWADVEVRVPRSTIHSTFKNHVGSLSADGLDGRLSFDTSSGSIKLRGCAGRVEADTGSGAIDAVDMDGVLSCDTGSGSVTVKGFDGDELRCDTGSGSVRASDVAARKLELDTGSGSIEVEGAAIEEFNADTGSGRIKLVATGDRLRTIKADTGSGGVSITLPADSTFELRADQGSGGIDCNFDDARAIRRDRKVVGYRRGDGKIWIDVETGSGSVLIQPAK
jgi:hypothetical protein